MSSMSNVIASRDLRGLRSIIDEEYGQSLIDEVAPALERGWKGQITGLDVVDKGTYLEAVRVTDVTESGDVTTVMIEAQEAAGYAGAIRRKGESDYVGRRVAEEGIRAAEDAISEALERTADRVKG